MLIITGSYPPMKCGVGAYTKKLVESLVKLKNVEVTVLTDIRAIGAIEFDGIDILPVVRGWRFIELIQIAKHVRRLSPDVVHIQYPTQGYTGKMPALLPLLVRLMGIPCVQTWHEPILGPGRFCLSLGLNALIAVSEELISWISAKTRIRNGCKLLSMIPVASNLPTVLLTEEERSIVRHKFVYEHETLLVFYGFVSPLKGIEVLFEIVTKTNAKLLMVCDLNPNDIYHKSLLDQLASLHIAPRIQVIEFQPDDQISTILAIADAVVLPFRDGARDNNASINGATAQGTFVMTTSLVHSGYKKDKNIYFAKPGNVDEMVISVEKYSGHRNPAVQTEFEWSSIAAQHIEIYQQVLNL